MYIDEYSKPQLVLGSSWVPLRSPSRQSEKRANSAIVARVATGTFFRGGGLTALLFMEAFNWHSFLGGRFVFVEAFRWPSGTRVPGRCFVGAPFYGGVLFCTRVLFTRKRSCSALVFSGKLFLGPRLR